VVTTIDTAALRAALGRTDGGRPQLVEVLPAGEFTTEHLPGAIHLPLTELTRRRATSTLDPSRPIVVYCFDFQ
jgi:rhodanese-related sulfurtransferase